MEFYIKQNSELPILQLRPIENKFWDELVSSIKTAKVIFSMYDDADCFKILNKSAVIEYNTKENDFYSIEDSNINIHDFRIEYKFTKKDTNKAGRYTGLFKIDFDGKVFPISLTINIVPSNIKTTTNLSEEIIYGLITDITDEYIATNNDEAIKYK